MPICAKCNIQFPNAIYVEGKRKTLHKRKYCLECSPAGDTSNSLRLTYGTAKIEIGEKYGHLTALSLIRDENKSRLHYLCICTCGKEVVRTEEALRTTKHGCGCFETNKRMIREETIKCNRCQIEKDLSEYTIGKHKRTYKNGSTREVPYHKKLCKSCVITTLKEKIDSKVEYKYLTIKSGCITRRISLEMTLEEFKNYWDMPCHYCNGPRRTHGLDRKDSKGPYSIENCVPCCSDCNYMKNTMSYEKFIDKLRNIANNLLID